MNTNHRKLQYVWKENRKINQKIGETLKRLDCNSALDGLKDCVNDRK